MERTIKRNIIRNRLGGNKGLQTTWRRYQERRGMIPYNPFKVPKKVSMAKRVMQKIVKMSRLLNRKGGK